MLFGAFSLAAYFVLQFGPGGLWRGFEPALAVTGQVARAPYDLTRLEANPHHERDAVLPLELLVQRVFIDAFEVGIDVFK